MPKINITAEDFSIRGVEPIKTFHLDDEEGISFTVALNEQRDRIFINYFFAEGDKTYKLASAVYADWETCEEEIGKWEVNIETFNELIDDLNEKVKGLKEELCK